MTTGPDERVLKIATERAEELGRDGARAVILTGSHARGDAHRESDLDLRLVADGPDKKLERRDGYLLSIAGLPAEEHREQFDDPSKVASVVPGWRSAVILYDPDSVANEIKQEALAWSWTRVEARCDEWVAKKITEYAEETQTLITDLELGEMNAAASQRSMIVMHVGEILAIHKRLLYETEKDLWDDVAKAMGSPYAETQSAALGLGDETFDDTTEAAKRVFSLGARETRHLLDDEQRAVVEHACKLAGHPL